MDVAFATGGPQVVGVIDFSGWAPGSRIELGVRDDRRG